MSLFGVVVPGRQCIFANPVNQNSQSTPSQWISELPNPGSIADALVFLTNPLPSVDVGAGIYYSFPPFSDWQFMDVLTNARPSVLLSTGWAFSPEASKHTDVRLGINIESAASLQEKLESTPVVDVKKEFARRVALNLYRYIESFQQGGDQSILDRWFERFESKYKIDPNFVMKTD